jgi:hypothetical protein
MAHETTTARKQQNANPTTRNEDTAQFRPTDEQVRFRAHQMYLARRGRGEYGDQFGDWMAAEHELNVGANNTNETAAAGGAYANKGRS